MSESRGISSTVGLAFINLDTGEAVLSQISDNQLYVRTIHKLMVFNPTTIVIASTAQSPKSKLFSIIEDNLDRIGSDLTAVDRKYYAETTGTDYISHLAFAEDVDALKTAVSGNYFAVCSFAALLKFVELGLARTFPYRSLRIKYEPPEGSMMIDLSTIHSMELVQNLHNQKSRDCLFGLLNETSTPMGGRFLRANILQPLTDASTLNLRYDALEELSTKEEMFFAVRSALKSFLDADKILTRLIIIEVQPSLREAEQSINNVIMLKQFVGLIKPIFEALTGARSSLLQDIRNRCAPENIDLIQELIDNVLNKDTAYAKQPLDLRNQRIYAVKAGVNGLLDVARLTYKEAMNDTYQHIQDLSEEYNIALTTKYEEGRQFYLRIQASELEERNLPPVFINVVRRKNFAECQTLSILKSNQKIGDAHAEVVMLSDKSVQGLIASVRQHMSILFKICDGIALLDMFSAFAQVVTTQDYVRPQMADTLAIRGGRHPIREKIHDTKFIANDVYATQQTRFQIITGCNMSGKSTYIRSVALMTVMAQIGCFVPAQYAAFPIMRQLFARISMDDNIEANVSTFAAEMREAAFILKNIDRQSMAIIDELGRGTSSRDGLAIAIAIAEALIESRALVWFATHFRDLANILSERNGVVSLHLAVNMSDNERMEMLYKIENGTTQEEHYGLKLARVVPLPEGVVDYAEHVAATLEQQMKKKAKSPVAILTARRRNLLLNIKEHLVQAKESKMDDQTLKQWLKDLQREFVVRMTALDEEARRAELGLDEDDDEEAEVDSGHEDSEDYGETESAAVQPPAFGEGRVVQDSNAEMSYHDEDGNANPDLKDRGSQPASLQESRYEL